MDPSAAERGALRYEVEALRPWFHNLHLPDGTETAPDHFLGDFPRYKWQELAEALPRNLHGWRVLDIGCNAGYYSFELAQRGAEVTALDANPHYLRQAHWAARQYGLERRIAFRHGQVYELAAEAGRYDLVLFLGVFYHLRYPTLALDIVARRTGRLLAFQTLTMPGEAVHEVPPDLPFDERVELARPGWPQMAFIEHRLADDPTNWWAPNHAAVEALLRAAGLRILGQPGTETWLCEPDPDAFAATLQRDEQEYAAATGRG